MAEKQYTEANIITLSWNEHIRERLGMYIGRAGDGSNEFDGIYVLLKEVMDNSIDEFMRNFGKSIEVTIKENRVTVRDYGRGIPLNKVVDCVSKINTGGKFDSEAYDTSIGMNGVGVKAVNALSTYFRVESYQDGKCKWAEFSKGYKTAESHVEKSDKKNGTAISFIPDDAKFVNYHWYNDFIDKMMWNYVYLNTGLTIIVNEKNRYYSKNGLVDLMKANVEGMLFEPEILKDDRFEFALTYTSKKYGEEYYSFVNSQYTPHGGTHQQAFREALVKTFRNFYGKDYDPADIRNSVAAALSIKVKAPTFGGQTKTKMESDYMESGGQTVRNYVNDVVCRLLDNYLHRHSDVAETIKSKIIESEKERIEIAGFKKKNKETTKKASFNNPKLRDCNIHFNTNDNRAEESMIFVTEGDSASGSITQSRNADTQAVFSLKGKPENVYKNKSRSFIKNEELNLLYMALNLEDGLDGLRYNHIIIATDADVDGMHIRMLMLTFFLKFFPEVIKARHLFILQTPLFRVRNRQETIYCYSEGEKQQAIRKLRGSPEITRFKGLGEISPSEFKNFIGDTMRLEPVVLDKGTDIERLLSFFMGDNNEVRKNFMMENLRDDLDDIEISA
ncbi:MAG: type IIA DNA topoisomerase subunit B [Bacteroidales bacterium]|jgi:topoisomerase-4 subunit B|nr:type IIA DNA topoisomerase subunit B [Bacteroidales bacterium]